MNNIVVPLGASADLWNRIFDYVKDKHDNTALKFLEPGK